MNIVKTAVKRPVGVVMIVILALILGFISVRSLAVELMPKMDLPVAVVATTYSGASPQEVEENVTDPVESAIGTIEGLDTVQSVSEANSSLVIMQFDFGTNLDSVLSDVRAEVDQVSGSLPEDAESPNVMELDPNATPVMTLSLSGESLPALQDIAQNDIQQQIERQSGVASASIVGGVEREIVVELNPAQLRSYGITGSQVSQALAGDNQSATAGTVQQGVQDAQIRIDNEFASLDDIRNTIIPLTSGETLRVSDVAAVEDTYKDRSSIATVNGEESLVFSVMKQSDANTVSVANEVESAISNINAQYADSDIQLQTIIDSSIFIEESVSNVTTNLIIGGLFAVIVLLLFLGSIKATLVIGTSIPIAVISTFTLLYFTGESLNILTLGGLALGVGMMLDSSIVILENIFKKKQEGLPLRQASVEGGSELASSVIASTLTTAAVFLPMIFVQGLAAQLFGPFSITVVFSLTMALVVALTLIPMLSSKWLGNVNVSFGGENEKRGIVNRILDWLKNVYGNVLEKLLKFRKTTIIVVSALILGSAALLPVVGFELIPSSDSGQATATVTTQSGATLEETVETTNQVTDRLGEYGDVIDTQFVDISAGEASIMFELVSGDQREMTTQEFVSQANERTNDVPGAEVVIQASGGVSTGSPISIELTGDELEVLDDLSQQVIWALDDVDGLMNVENSTSASSPEINVNVNPDLASEYGLTTQEIINQLSVAFNGQAATTYAEEGSEYDVTVEYPDEQTNSIRDLETMTITNSEGTAVPLLSVADLVTVQGPTSINHTDQTRAINVTADLQSGYTLGEVSQNAQSQLDQLVLPDGYEVNMGGQTEQMTEAMTQLVLALLLGIFLIYMVMAVQFESFTYPFIIMFSLPTMIIGVTFGLFVTNTAISVVTMIGLIMLAGVVVNNGIILVDYINILRRRGIDRHEAIVEGGKSRLRPIFMTALTTILAMVPMAIGIGEGSEMQQPMAVTVVFGLTFGTFFTLLFVPVVYLVIDNISVKGKNLFSRKKKSSKE